MRRLTTLFLTLAVLLSLGSAAVMAQQVHVVQRGETLFAIARQYGRTVAEIAQANGLSQPYIIHAGNQLTIPVPGGAAAPAPAPAPAPAQPSGATTHTVQRGESLAVIAAQYNTNYIELARMNGIEDPNILACRPGASGAGAGGNNRSNDRRRKRACRAAHYRNLHCPAGRLSGNDRCAVQYQLL